MRALLVSVLVAIVSAWPSRAQERRVPGFVEAVAALTSEVRRAAPERYAVEVHEATPQEMGWRPSREGTPARVLVVMAPSGAVRVFGLLPREGTYTPAQEPGGCAPRLVTIGPALVVVGALFPEPAMTLDALRAAAPGLDRATATITAWEEPAAGEVATPFVRGEVARVERRAGYVSVDVKAGGSVDLDAAWEAGVGALAHRVLPEEGGFVPPTISIAPPSKR